MGDDPQRPLPENPAVRGVGEVLFEGIGHARGLLGGAVGVAAAIVIAVVLGFDSKLPLWIVLLAGWLLLWLAIGSMSAVVIAVKETRSFSDRAVLERQRFEMASANQITRTVRAVVVPFSPHTDCSCVLIVECSLAAALTPGTTVTIAINLTTHELPLGFGTVRALQTDGKVVVALERPSEGAKVWVPRLLASGEEWAKVRVGSSVATAEIQATFGTENEPEYPVDARGSRSRRAPQRILEDPPNASSGEQRVETPDAPKKNEGGESES
ncbi:MAG: hypothetical protein ACYCWW_03995 [Deltaproteobacteria bacterium]